MAKINYIHSYIVIVVIRLTQIAAEYLQNIQQHRFPSFFSHLLLLNNA
jgi:hypothetical protein